MVKMAPWITGLSRVRLRAADIVSRGLRIGGGGSHRGNGDDSNSNDCSVPSGMTTVLEVMRAGISLDLKSI